MNMAIHKEWSKHEPAFRNNYLAAFTVFVLAFFPFLAFSQVDTTKVRQRINAYGYDYKNISVDSSFRIPRDTFPLRKADSGAIAIKAGVLYQWSGANWDSVSASGSGGGSSFVGDSLTWDYTAGFDSLIWLKSSNLAELKSIRFRSFDNTVMSIGKPVLTNTDSTLDYLFTVNNTTAQWNANRLSGRLISTAAPADLQYLGWNNSTSLWEPKTLPSGGGTPGGVGGDVQLNNGSGGFGPSPIFSDGTALRFGIPSYYAGNYAASMTTDRHIPDKGYVAAMIAAAGGGAGTVTSFAFTDGGGFDGTVTNATTTPTLSLTLQDAVADGSTKGQSTFTAADFNGTGFISIDYTNGQAASGSTKGFLTSADWTTFNSKLSNITGLVSAGTNVTVTGTGASGDPYVINSSGSGGGSSNWTVTGSDLYRNSKVRIGSTVAPVNTLDVTGKIRGIGEIIVEETSDANGAVLDQYFNKASPAANDRLSELHSYGNTSTGAKAQYTAIYSESPVVTNGAQSGRQLMNVTINNSVRPYFDAGPNATNDGVLLKLVNGVYADETTGKLGIGVSAPAGYLQVNKSVNGQVAGGIANTSTGSIAYAEWYITDDASLTYTSGLRLTKLGANWVTDGAYKQDGGVIAASNDESGGLSIGAFNSSGAIRFYTGGTTNANERMNIASDGRINFLGVSSTSWSTAQLNAYASSTKKLYMGYDASINMAKIGAVTEGASHDNVVINPDGGDLLVGSTSDNGSFLLQVGGNSRFGGTLMITGGSPGSGKILTSDASGNATWETPSGGGGGLTGVTTFGSTPNANGLSVSGSNILMQPADGSNPGGVSTTTQTFAGLKTFSSGLRTGTPVGGTAGTWKLGSAVNTTGLVMSTTQYVEVDIGGTLYRLGVVEVPAPSPLPEN